MPATSEIQQGLAKIFGLGAGAMTVLTGAATLTITGADVSHENDLIEDEDQEGNVETLIAFKERLEGSIDFIPNGATRAAAIISATNSQPGMITKIVLASFDVPVYNGNWNYIGGWNIKKTRSGIVICGIKIRAHLANRSALTAGVISG